MNWKCSPGNVWFLLLMVVTNYTQHLMNTNANKKGFAADQSNAKPSLTTPNQTGCHLYYTPAVRKVGDVQ